MVIKNVVFDLGRVLVHFDHGISFDAFEKHGVRFDRSQFFHDYRVDAYERGEITGEDFLLSLQRSFPKEIPLETIRSGWQDIFSPMEEMLALAARLRQNYRTYILSNTCDLHWNYIDERYQITSLVDGTVTSFEARARKPEIEIYRFAEKKLEIVPEESVFIDDIAANAKGAADAGWHAVHHVDAPTTMTELRRLGIRWARESC